MTRREVLIVIIAGGLALLAACGSSREERFRYKMTVEVNTPQGVKTGHAVRELHFNDRSSFPLGESRPQISVRGEAVAVDLPGGRTLFALLTSAGGDGDYGARVADREGIWGGQQVGRAVQVWPRPPYPGDPRDHEDYQRGHALEYPMLVRFADITDPKSVEQVKPDALEAAFGPGVRLLRITVQATDEDVTEVIGERMGWLRDSAIMDNPGWSSLPLESREVINGLFSGTIEVRK